MKETDVGEKIRSMRELKCYSRDYFAELIGISVSHLEKIEVGARRPGIGTFIKILDYLDADIVMNNENDTIGQCISKMRDIIQKSTDEQALFILKIIQCLSENINMLIKSDD